MAKRILIVEDEPGIQDFLGDVLEDAGFTVSIASDGMEGLLKFQNEGCDLVLLDIMLPKIDGYAVLELIRKQSSVPVIMLTALDAEENQLKGFDLLADDYIVKPSTAALIVKRVLAALRHSGEAEEPGKSLISGALRLDTQRYTVTENGQAVPLTLKEFVILRLLLENKGRVITRDVILDQIWGIDYYGDERVINVHFANLRKKLKGDYIETVRGVGYKFHETT